MNDKQKEKNKKDTKVSDVDDHITKRYELKKRLGKGAYGIVWKAIDKKNKEVVAVKKIFEAFRNQTDAQRTFREIMFLQAFKDHPNIIKLRGLHRATNNKDIYLIFDFMDTDLHHVIKRETVLKDVHKRYIMYQLFRATRYLHSGNVIHRDQKPSNILINAECKIKIADFGLARSLAHATEDEDDGILTDYVATRWYRAPEILVASKKYTKGVDMWSLGCILGEMLLGKPLFPGSSTVNQMERIMAALPEPTSKEVYNMCSGYGKSLLEGHASSRTTLQDLIKNPCEEAMDLVKKLLVFDPNKRLTATEALNHSYVAKFRSGNEQTLNCSVVPPLDDDVQLTVSEYRNKLYEMMASARRKRHPSPTPVSPTLDAQPTNDRKQLEKLSRTTDYLQRVNYPESRHSEDKNLRNRHKVLSAEDARDRILARQTGASQLKQDKIGNQKKLSSPNHRGSVPQSRGGQGWSDRRILCAMPKAAQTIKQRYEEIGGGDANILMRTATKEPSFNHQQIPFRNTFAQVKEKLRQNQGMNGHLATLPKVSQKRDLPRQNSSSSPPPVTRYNPKHGVLTTSALQEIRAVLKH